MISHVFEARSGEFLEFLVFFSHCNFSKQHLGRELPMIGKSSSYQRRRQGRHVKKGWMALEDLLRLPSGKLT